jgi:hypothetical protein
MEAFFDKYDSILKTAVYGSAFCRYLVSKRTSSEETLERIEQVTDISYRVRSVFGLIGVYLDWRSFPSSRWISRPNGKLVVHWREACQFGVVASGMTSNLMDFFAAVLWIAPRLRSLFARLRSWLNVAGWLRPKPFARRAPEAEESESSNSGDLRERIEWLSNVMWATMSALSLVSSLYAMHRAIRKAQEARMAPKPLVLNVKEESSESESESESEEEDEPSVSEAGLEALECALDLVGGASGAFKLECEAEGLTGIGPTLASCLHFGQLVLMKADDPAHDESSAVVKRVESSVQIKSSSPAVQVEVVDVDSPQAEAVDVDLKLTSHNEDIVQVDEKVESSSSMSSVVQSESLPEASVSSSSVESQPVEAQAGIDQVPLVELEPSVTLELKVDVPLPAQKVEETPRSKKRIPKSPSDDKRKERKYSESDSHENKNKIRLANHSHSHPVWGSHFHNE